ncbi:hypothetical protein HN51_051698 [Arachis hypogaea]
MFKIALKECRHVFENLGSIVDVGGVSKLIHQEFSQLKCTVFDQSEVVGNLKGDGNLNFVAVAGSEKIKVLTAKTGEGIGSIMRQRSWTKPNRGNARRKEALL